MDGDYEELIEDLRKARAVADQVRGAADSEDGLVSVIVGLGGEVLQLDLDPRILRSLDSVGLAQAVVETIGRAQQDAQRQAFAALEPYLPPGATFDTTDLNVDPMLAQLEPRGSQVSKE